MDTCGQCGYDLRGHASENACPECGSRLRAPKKIPLASFWFAWGLIALGVLYLPAIGVVFLGLAFDKSSYDLFMRVLVAITHGSLLTVSIVTYRQIRRSPKLGLRPRYWCALICGFSPLFFYAIAIALLILVDTGVISFNLYAIDIHFILNLVVVFGMIGSIVLLMTKPYQPRIFISIAMPLHGLTAGMMAYTVLSHYHIY